MNSWKPAALLTFLALPFGLRAMQMYRAMPEIPPIDSIGRPARNDTRAVAPSLSIIIPARNEAENLRRLLPALNHLEYAGELEIIVVDDHSQDATRAVAESFGARVVRVETLPEGWHGKPHACHVGAQNAQGEWILFTDADTLHDADSAMRAVAFARDAELDGLTLFLRQHANGMWDGIVLTTAFAGLFAGVRRNDDLMNGQYILLRHSVYQASGGFAAVRSEALEDLALAAHLRKLGYKFLALRGESAAAVRMYANTTQMWHGMTRLGAGSLKYAGAGAVMTALFTTALMSPLLVLMGVLTRSLHFAWLPITWFVSSASVLPFARRFGAAWWALLAPFGALFVLLAAWWGIFRASSGAAFIGAGEGFETGDWRLMTPEILWVLTAYFFGTLPLSVWFGNLFLQRDIRTVGDGNPGASNFFKAGGKRYIALGICVMLLEVFKAMVPVMFGVWWAGLQDWWLVALAIAPVVGNAFSPFLKFRGGKSIAVILGVWGGLTFFIIPGLLGMLFFIWVKLLKNSAWGILLAYLSILVLFLLLRSDWIYFAVWFGTFLILVYKWRDGLKSPPDLRQTIFGKIFSRP